MLVNSGQGNFPVAAATGRVSALSFMVNGLIDLGPDDGPQVFAGGGAGYSHAQVNVFIHTQFLPGSVDNQLGGSPCIPGGTIAVCSNPITGLGTGRPTATRLPREFQFGLKLYF